MRIRVLIAAMCCAGIAAAQTPTPLACDVVVAPSDSSSGRLGAVAEGPGGRLAWSDGRSAEFLLRDAKGKVRTIGRQGSGPGDFNRVSKLGWFGDTVWATDGSLPRVTFFTDTGRLIRVATGMPQVAWLPRPDGRLVGVAWIPLGGPTWPPTVVVAQRAGALSRDTLRVFTTSPVEHFQLPPTGASNPQPFSFREVAASAPDGSRFCSARPEGDDTRIDCIDDRGRSVLDKVVTLRPRALTDAVYDSTITVYARAGRTESAMRDLIKRPRNLPALVDLQLDASGSMWLRRSHVYEPVAHWTRLRADGSIRDDVVIPRDYRLIEPDGDSFWASRADDDGLETLYRCRVR